MLTFEYQLAGPRRDVIQQIMRRFPAHAVVRFDRWKRIPRRNAPDEWRVTVHVGNLDEFLLVELYEAMIGVE